MSIILAADTGGMFTDLVGHDQDTGRVVYAKSLTTYDNLIQVSIRRILRKHGFPPDLQSDAIKKVVQQAEVLAREVA